MAENGNKFDILKLVLAILIVGIHSTKAGMILRPVFRLAVPLFFIISSYLFFLKQCTLSSWRERYKGLKKYAKRINKLASQLRKLERERDAQLLDLPTAKQNSFALLK